MSSTVGEDLENATVSKEDEKSDGPTHVHVGASHDDGPSLLETSDDGRASTRKGSDEGERACRRVDVRVGLDDVAAGEQKESISIRVGRRMDEPTP